MLILGSNLAAVRFFDRKDETVSREGESMWSLEIAGRKKER